MVTAEEKQAVMLAYHNDPAVKAKYVARFAAHREADEVIQGTGFDNGRGCFVGCTLDNYDHERFPIELGWPEWLARLADQIFEGLPQSEAPAFGSDILDAVRVGADLERVRVPFLVAVQRRGLERLRDNNEPYAQQVRDAIQGVIDWLLAGADESAAWSAAESAESAAESAAWSAARSAESAESAESARSAAWSARSAAWSAAESAAESAESARSAAWSAAESAESAAESAESAAESAESAAAESAESAAAEWAESAAESAAWSARSAAWSAAESAAWSARSAAWSAARSAESAAAESAAESESQQQRDDLLNLLRT